jgi:coproporphyrinogen III oxidase-like Fe-S oxidoreductase
LKDEESVCPRCGRVGGYLWSRTVNNRKYYYWVHEFKDGGKRVVERCYLGPEEYYHAAIFNPIGLAGALDKERFIKYAKELLNKLNDEQKRWLLQALENELYQKGRGLLKRLTKR